MYIIALIFGIGLVIACIYAKNRRRIFVFTKRLIFAFTVLLLCFLLIKLSEQSLAPSISTKFFIFSICVGILLMVDMLHSRSAKITGGPLTVMHMQNLFKMLWRHHCTVELMQDFLSYISTMFKIKKLVFLLQREKDDFYWAASVYGWRLKEPINFHQDNPLIKRLKLIGYTTSNEECGQPLAKLDMDCALGIFTSGNLNGALLLNIGEKYDESTLTLLRRLTQQFISLLWVLTLVEQQRYRFGQVTLSLLTALEYKYPMHLKGHPKRIAFLATMLGKKLGLDKDKLDDLRLAAYLHDIGELHIPTELLSKTGKLSFQEFDIIKQHPQIGANILQHSFSDRIVEAVRYHHERPDGHGYYGKREDQISLFAKILGICEVWDALTSPRPYRHQLSFDEAIKELQRVADIQVPSKLVDELTDTVTCMMKNSKEKAA